jgi:hypothetical protein
MSRLHQLNAGNYGSSRQTSAEFENIIRYLNAAEYGNKTLAELLKQLFNEETGEFDGPIEFRVDPTEGLQYRIGEWVGDFGWQTLAALDDLRGTPGRDVGEIGAPIFHGRQDFVAVAAQTAFTYAYLLTDSIVVFKNGLIQREGPAYDYQLNPSGGVGAGAVVFNVAMAGGEKVTIFKVRSTTITGYTRVDVDTVAPQAVFPFVHSADTRLLVYKNGILQREGGGFDYTTSPDTDTITFTSTVGAGNRVTIMTVENTSSQAVTGLMLEDRFCDPTTGLINYAKLAIANAEIPMAKVNGLAALNSAAARITVAGVAPVGPTTGNLWLDTSISPNSLKFWDGIQWLKTTPDSSLPTFTNLNAGQFLKVNGTGTALEFSAVDFSSLIPVSQKGAAAGVATLDSSAKLPAAQLPDAVSRGTLSKMNSGALANGTIKVHRFWNQKIKLEAVALRLSGGTATAQLAINGVAVGSTFAISVTPVEIKLGQGGNPDAQHEVDALASSKTVDVIITAATGANDLDVAVGYAVVAT